MLPQRLLQRVSVCGSLCFIHVWCCFEVGKPNRVGSVGLWIKSSPFLSQNWVCWRRVHLLPPNWRFFSIRFIFLFYFFISKFKFKLTKMHKFDVHKSIKIQRMVIIYLFLSVSLNRKKFLIMGKIFVTPAKTVYLWALSFLLLVIIFPVKISIHIQFFIANYYLQKFNLSIKHSLKWMLE